MVLSDFIASKKQSENLISCVISKWKSLNVDFAHKFEAIAQKG